MENQNSAPNQQPAPAAVLTEQRLNTILDAAWSIGYIRSLLASFVDRLCEDGLILSREETIGPSSQIGLSYKAAAEITSE